MPPSTVAELHPKPFICVRYVFVTLAESWHAQKQYRIYAVRLKLRCVLDIFGEFIAREKRNGTGGLNSRINIAADVAVINLPPDFRLVRAILYPGPVVCRIGF